jgi:hypothetical protein
MIRKDRLDEQERGIALYRRVARGEPGAWDEVGRTLRKPGRAMTRAFAAYAAGRFRRDEFAGDLIAIVVRSDGRCVEPAFSASYALARLGRRQGAPILVQGLDHREYLVRRLCFESLKALAGEDFGFVPYRSPGQQAQAVERWMSWATQTKS